MVYNYYYSLVSCFFLLVIFICVAIQFSGKSLQNKRFLRLVAALMVATFIETLSSITFRSVNAATVSVNMWLNAINFISISLTAYFYGLYIDGYIYEDSQVLAPARNINRVIIVLYSIAHITNYFGHFLYYFDGEFTYCHGIIYPIVVLTPVYFLFYGIIRLISHKASFTTRQFFPILFISVFVIGASIVQYTLIPSVLIGLFAATLAVIVVFFFLETPDYKVLYRTMDELKKAEEVAQEERLKAYAANQAKSSFLANVSHEIRTPLNAVLGMNEMILRETKEENVAEYAMDVNAAGMSLLSIINDILDISKIEAGKMEVIPVEYELPQMIDDLVNMISTRAKEKGLDFEVKVDSALPTKLLGDDLRLKQIIMNLLSNAVKYTKEGKVTFTVSGEQNEGILKMHISVKDTGIGIKDEEKEGLFKAFQRLDERANRSIEGTGLGMSISSNLLAMMGSQIYFESEYGKGSDFYFDVDQKIIDDTPIGDIEETLKQQAKKYVHKVKFTAPDSNILVVDDNSINRKVVNGFLKEIGCHVDEAAGGYECLDKVKLKHYDLILLDHLMPDLDGVWTLEKIKSEENLCNDTPVIAFTANAVTGMKESFLCTGFSGFISKPVDSDKLEEVLLEFLPKEQIHEGELILGNPVDKEEPLPELDDFDFKYAHLCLGKNEVIKSVAKDFYEQIDRIENALNTFAADLENADSMSRYRTDVHSLKSTARMLGEIQLSGLAKAAEEAAKAKDSKTVTFLHPLVIAELKKAKSELEEILPKEEKNIKISIEKNILIEKLEDLKASIEARDIQACDEKAKDLEGYSYSEAVDEQLAQLIEYIKIIKFLKASAQLEELLKTLEGE